MEIARHWRLQKVRYGLVGEICANCDSRIFPPRDICPDCNHGAKEPFKFSGLGEIYSFTTVTRDEAPQEFQGQAPYVVAHIKLEEGPLVTAQLTDLGDQKPEIGLPVEMVTRRLRVDGDEERGIIVYGYKFRPALSPSSTGTSRSSR